MKEKIVPILHKFFLKIKQEETLPDLFYEASINLVLDRDITRSYSVPHEHTLKNSKQNFSKSNSTIYKKDNTS